MKNEMTQTIAIVDDNALVRETMHFRLTHLGYQVPMQAEHGQEFLEKLMLAGDLPDMVLLDINMPIMDGFETAMALRRQYPEIKILFFSLETGTSCMKRVSDVGADGFVAKDAPFQEVKDALARIMHGKYVA